jgi:prepilin-type N-terminal cleavage/methylation domain-containing protein
MCTYNKGFSLAELMLVLALTAIVAAFAIPSYRLIIAKTNMKLACQQVENTIATAREAAINHHDAVIFCGSQNGLSCDGNWSEGQLILHKHSSQTIAYGPALPVGIMLEWRGNLGRNQALEFTPLGLSAGQWGSFWLKSPWAGGRVTVNALGQVTSVQVE